MPLPASTFADQFSITRGGSATVLDLNGDRTDVPASSLRFDFSSSGGPRGILIEGPDTNYATNPLFAGVVAGTPPTGTPPSGGTTGAPPTGLTVGSGAGMTAQIEGVQTIRGNTALVVRYYGVRSAATTAAAAMTAAVPYAVADAIDAGVTLEVLSGDPATLSVARCALTAGGQTITGASQAGALASGPALCSIAKAPNSGGSAGSVTFFAQLDWVIGAQIDMRVAFYAPYLVKSGRPEQSYIRPASPVIGASSRNRDDVRFRRVDYWDWGRMAAGANVGATVLLEFMLQRAAPAGVDQGLLRLDDATPLNREEFYAKGGTSQIWARRVVGGTVVAELALGNYTPMTPFRLLHAGKTSERVAVVSGGDITPIPLGDSFVTARAILGSITTDDTSAAWGWFRYGYAYPKAQPNGTLLQLTTLPASTIEAEGNV